MKSEIDSNMDDNKIDPITLEVMRNAFYSISEEMNAALIRASYSTNIKDRRDASCAIYTASGDIVVVAQSEMGTPLHLGTCLLYTSTSKRDRQK